MPELIFLKHSDLKTEQEWTEVVQNFPYEEFMNWFSQQKRDLPWRHNPSFYEVLVSEFMLQQTVVLAVLPYYLKWMKAYPSLHHLASASSEEVLKSWEGLGYYSRARRLHLIAKTLVNSSIGMPSSYKELKELQGIGDYTANAILAFAFKKPVIAVDGNVLRVGARYLGIQESIQKLSVKRLIQLFFDSCYKEDGSMAEALIELGAIVCRKKPQCDKCPLQGSCVAYLNNLQEKIPAAIKRPKIKQITNKIVVCVYNDMVLIRRHSKNLMKDLCEFPNANQLSHLGINLSEMQQFQAVKASYTSFKETLIPFLYKSSCKFDVKDHFWAPLANFDKLTFSSGHKKIKTMIFSEKEDLKGSF